MKLFQFLIMLIFLLPAVVEADYCRTFTLPNSNGNGGAFWYTVDGSGTPFGLGRAVDYRFPTTAKRVGLVFWDHEIPLSIAPGSTTLPQGIRVDWYVNNPAEGRGAQRVATFNHRTPAEYAQKFAMSTPMSPGDQLVVGWENYVGQDVLGLLIVTIYECYADGVLPPPIPSSGTALLTLTGLSVSASGAQITLSASATGGLPTYQYKYWYTLDGVAWVVFQDWTTTSTATWTRPAGSYPSARVGVWIKSGNNLADIYDRGESTKNVAWPL